ncbi:MAG: DEAD/DEAH box helicase [Erysipelotrichaceae bacterium]|nr:DEAD/DEAH box helicase [Erysipelotrichaceae bacterium]
MFNPVKASKNIKEEFIDYISTSFSFADSDLREQFIEELEKNIDNGPWLEINDVFKSGKSINELIDDGVLSPLFKELEAKKPNDKLHKKCLPLDRPLYLHQENAIRAINSGNNVVVSTGTGSGKTNCFLIPVLNELLREKEKGTLGPGVRALFIYPMNALANDQMKNLRKILMYYPDITFGVYNGATENKQEDAVAVYEAMFANEPIPELRSRLKNELLSRDEMKDNPPNILFTNYAMLEHLLFRPSDDVLFSNSDFKYVVLDEAHVYSGATGIETSILLRRLRARIYSSRETQFILTSATLGDETSNDDVIRFANNLCGVDFDVKNIIRGTRVQYIPSEKSIDYPLDLFNKLADESNYVSDVLNEYGIIYDKNKDEKELLYDLLVESELYQLFRRDIDRITTLNDVKDILGLDEETTISFISLCTKASKNGKLLIDARYHFFIRSLEGCYLTLSPSPRLFLTRQKHYQENKTDYSVFEVAICDDCGKFAIVGKEENHHLVHVAKLDQDVDYYFLTSEENDDIEEDEDVQKLEHYYLCPHCGALTTDEQLRRGAPCDHSLGNFIKIVKAKKMESGGARCGNCHRGTYHRLYLGNDAATSVLATALYEELPEAEYIEEEGSNKTTNLFARASTPHKKKEIKTGRQFLAFSDSRQEAAKFACYLSKSYDEFLRRRGICQIINEDKDSIIKNIYTISDFVVKLTSFYSNKRSFAQSNTDNNNLTVVSRKNAWVAMLNELARYSSTTSLTSLGVLQFSYLGNTPEIVKAVADTYGVNEKTAKNLLDILVFEIVKTGAICADNDTDIDDNDREYIFYTPSQKFVTKLQSPDKRKTTVSDWMPRNKGGHKDKFYKTNKLYYVTNFLSINENEASEFLEQYFDYLTKPENGNKYLMVDKNKDGTYVMPAKYFQVKIAGDPTAKWFRCNKCGKVSQFNMDGHCITARCNALVEEVEPESLNYDNHFAKLYFSNRMSPLFIKEHTAQLSKKESTSYQEQFVKKEINALSCSTTFEMGVDVGDLETVFLRDVPPLPSNYAQRAGRAGRSVDAAAYCLTFAKLSSHDLFFFKDPKRIISGIILPPLFKVDNEKIVRRHIYAIALSMFFADHPEQYNHNDAELFINKKGYKQFIDWINTKPDRLRDMIKKSIPNIDNLYERLGIDNFDWIEDFSGKEGVFTSLINEYETNIENFENIIKEFKRKNDLEQASKNQKRLNNYTYNKLIEFLARGNILPRYGFPVDTVELEQNTTASNINKLRLSRDLSIAIAEYAPSSEVIADGRMYTSRYIKKSNIGTNRQEWHTAFIGTCNNPECQCVVYNKTPIEDGIEVKCPSCGDMLSKVDFFESIEPRSGFISERKDKDVPLSRQEKNYRSDDYYVGNTQSKTIGKSVYRFNGIKVTVESTTNDSLMVKSYNNFYVCPLCGYAIAEDETITGDNEANKLIKQKAHKITTTGKHESCFGPYDCNCQELVRFSLHHIFNTDVAKISFGCDTSDYKTMVSVMYAILYAISEELNIERKDIKACLSLKVIDHKPNYSVIVYDAVPGGAGHSRRLVTSDGRMLYKIINVALFNMVSCKCEPSCYNCLRSYENQKIHDDLDRKLAAKFLEQLIGDIKLEDKE